MRKVFLLVFFLVYQISFSQEEITANEINFNGERAFKNGMPYTGIIYSFEKANNDCRCLLEANYVNGYLHGEKKEWHKNGNIKFIGTYRKGKLIENAKLFDLDGNIIKDIKNITEEEILLYFLKLFPPNIYTDKFLNNYLYISDVNYSNYNKNESELKRKIESAKSKIENKVKDIKFSQVFNVSGSNITLSKYSFDNESYTILNSHNSNFVKVAGISKSYVNDFFSMYNESYFNSINIKPINGGEFYGFKISPQRAEILRTNLKSSFLYYSYNYKILPININDDFNRESKMTDKPSILCFITELRLYSDKERKNVLQIIYPETSYEDILDKYNNNETTISDLNNTESIISQTILRTKMGSLIGSGKLNYNTITEGYLEELFNNELKIRLSNNSLNELGFTQIGTNKFKYKYDYKTYTQKQIYERIIIEKARNLLRLNSELGQEGNYNDEKQKYYSISKDYLKGGIWKGKKESYEFISNSKVIHYNKNSEYIEDFMLVNSGVINIGTAPYYIKLIDDNTMELSQGNRVIDVLKRKENNNKKENVNNSKSKNDSVEYLLQNAENGDKIAQNQIGLYYFNGKNGFGNSHYPFEKDIQKAKYWFKKAAEQGSSDGQENLGAIYFEEKDYNNALIWYTKAANSNHSRAQYLLGFMYNEGLGVKKSRKNAKFWLQKSCSLGYINSCNELKKMNALGNAILNAVLGGTIKN